MKDRLRKVRRVSTCHIKREWDDAENHWTEMWCGKRGFIEHTDTPPKPTEEQRTKFLARPWKHCTKCVRAKRAAHPDWFPKAEDTQ